MGPMMARTAETTNYEVSKLVRHSIVPRGELARLWVAVILDDDVLVKKGDDGQPVRSQKPRTAAELQKIQGLVAAAVGLDQSRGDQLTVENVAFDAPALDLGGQTTTAVPGVVAPRTLWVALGVGGVLVALVLIVVAAKVFAPRKSRPTVAGVAAVGGGVTQVELPTTLPRTIQELQQEIEAQIDKEAKATGSHRMPVLAKRVSALAAKEPEAAALLVRNWLTEEQH
jgi:flagellar M-ring protein FliF